MKQILSLIVAAALAGCASRTAEPDAAAYAKYSCGQLAILRGNTFEVTMSKSDLAVLERASIEKGCNIEFR